MMVSRESFVPKGETVVYYYSVNVFQPFTFKMVLNLGQLDSSIHHGLGKSLRRINQHFMYLEMEKDTRLLLRLRLQ